MPIQSPTTGPYLLQISDLLESVFANILNVNGAVLSSNTRFSTVLLPESEGPEMTIRLPLTPAYLVVEDQRSLDILNHLSDPLDGGFDFDDVP